MAEPYQHRTEIPSDDGSQISFKWHFKRGILKKRMSGYELAMFVLNMMPGIIPLLSDQPRVQAEFQAMMILLATSPKKAIDQILPWIRTIIHGEEDDIIHLSLYDKTEQRGPAHFVMP